MTFDLHPNDFCMMWSHHDSCTTKTFITGSEDSHIVKKPGQLIINSYLRCELIASGYLRGNLVNPVDISTIIGKFLGNTEHVEFCIKNNHDFCTILFPGMKQVVITFCQMFFYGHGCTAVGCKNCHFFHCGIIGIPKTTIAKSDKREKEWNMQQFYKKFKQYDSKMREFNHVNEMYFRNMRDALDLKSTTMIGYDNQDSDDGLQVIYEFEMEMIDCDVTRWNPYKTSSGKHELMKIDYNIAYYGSLASSMHDQRIVSSHPISSEKFSIETGQSVVLQYDDKENTFSIEFYDKRENNSDCSSCIVNATSTQNIRQKSPIIGKNDKLQLKKGFDYVIAVSAYGCHERHDGKNNVYSFSAI